MKPFYWYYHKLVLGVLDKVEGNKMQIKIDEHVFQVGMRENQIECMILFGSYVNKEHDEKSDIDLVIIVDECTREELRERRRKIAEEMGVPSRWLMMYTKSYFKKRAYKGGLFYQGLKAYGRIIYQRSHYINHVFQKMPKETNNIGEMYQSRRRVTETLHAYKKGKIPLERIMAVVAFQIRNVCMHICNQHGKLEVRKYEPVRACLNYPELEMPFTLGEFQILYQLKREYMNNPRVFRLPLEFEGYVMEWIRRYMLLINQRI